MLSAVRPFARASLRLQALRPLSAAAAAAPKPPASAIKELREVSGGAPLMAVRAALLETYTEDGGFDMDAALKHLRLTEGNKIKAKTADRKMSEGLVCLTTSKPGSISAVALGCETDFAGKSQVFVNLLQNFAARVSASDTSVTKDNVLENDAGLKKMWDDAALSVRENMSVRDLVNVQAPASYFATYVHGKVGEHANPTDVEADVGKVGAYVEVKAAAGKELSNEELDTVGRALAMHVVAVKPRFLSMESVPASVLEEEREFILTAMADEEKTNPPKKPKPAEMKLKIAEGKLNKWAQGIVLLEQEHVANGGDNIAVKKVVAGAGVEVVSFGLMTV
jgi:elongation factor Ts